MEALKWILSIGAILGLYYFVKKYAEKNSKDLFFYGYFVGIIAYFLISNILR